MTERAGGKRGRDHRRPAPATRRPLPESVTEALTNDEPAERRVISLATTNTPRQPRPR
jgi:hypothetical protein